MHLHAGRSEGSRIFDLTGQSYIDMCLGCGTHICGHHNPSVIKGIEAQLTLGTLWEAPSSITYEVGALMAKMLPMFEGVIFCSSGTEATIRAVRIVRAYTGKNKIAMFTGGWHGGNDSLLYEEDYRSSWNRPTAVPKSAGLPKILGEPILMLPYGNEASYNLIEENRKELAAVIVEPAQGAIPRSDMRGFLHGLREVTNKSGVLLCLDEVITGFRLGLGGGQEFYEIDADLATYGKILGGGLPIGAVAGRRDIMQTVGYHGMEGSVFMGGTFSANPLAMSAAKAVLIHLDANKMEIYSTINSNGESFRRNINHYCKKNDHAVRAMGIGSISRIMFTLEKINSRRDRDAYDASMGVQELFYLHLLLEGGVFVGGNRILFLSTAHSSDDLLACLAAIKQSISYVSDYL